MRPLLWVVLAGCAGNSPSGTDDSGVDEVIAYAGEDQFVPVGEALTLDGLFSQGASFVWDFGDGTSAEGLIVEHSWDAPGRYPVVLQVTGPDGDVVTDTALVVVHQPVAAVAPRISRSLAVFGEDVFVVTPESGTLTQISGIAAAEVDVCPTPRAVSAGPEGVAVVCADRWVTGVGTPDVRSTPLPTGADGRAIVWDGERHQVATRALGEVHSDQGAAPLGTDTVALSVDPEGRLWSAQFRSPADGGLVFVDGSPIGLAYDAGPDSDTGNRGVPNLVGEVVISPDGGTAYLPVVIANTARGGFLDGQPLTHETTVRAAVIALDTETGEERWRRQLDDQGQAGHIALDPLGYRLFVAFPGTQTILELDAYSGNIRDSILFAGNGLNGMVVSDDGQTLITHAWLDREVVAWDVGVSPPRRAWSQQTVAEEPLAADVLRGKQLFHDAADLRIARDGYLSCAVCHPGGDHDGQTWDFTDRGEGLRNTTSLLGRAGLAMGPLHWSGNFDEVQDFEHDMRAAFEGTGMLDDADFAATDDPLGAPKAGLSEDLDALAAYVATLDQTPVSPFAGGEVAVLEAQGCTSCHAGPLYTDSAVGVRHDVGTLTDASGQRLGGVLDGLDTPTLLGLWDSAPYLHDGSARSLEEAVLAHTDVPDDVLAEVVEALRGL